MNDTSSNNNPASGFDENSYRIAKYLSCKYNGAKFRPTNLTPTPALKDTRNHK